jgi:hypothetical protein
MAKDLTYKDHHDINIVSSDRMNYMEKTKGLLPPSGMDCKIHEVTIRIYSDDTVSIFTPTHTLSKFAYDDYSYFLLDWQILNRRILIEKIGKFL